DDASDDAPVGGEPPHPLDRVWLHPSELPAHTVPPRARRPVRQVSSMLVPALAGAVGAPVAVAVLALTGTLDRSPSPSAASGSTPATGAPASQVVANAATIGLSMVAVSARDTDGARRGSGVCVRHGTEVLTSARLIGNATD